MYKFRIGHFNLNGPGDLFFFFFFFSPVIGALHAGKKVIDVPTAINAL